MLDRHIRAGAVAALLTGFLVAPAAAAEPSLVRDFHPGTERLQNYADTYASRLVVDGIYYFPASDPAHGMELWRTDGTPAGTYRVTDICPGPCGAGPFNLQLYQGEIYFSANDGVSGVELWASTGIPGNARRVRDLCPGPCNGHPRSLEVFKGRLLFIASSGPEWQLWSSDGSRRGTVAVRSFCPYEETSDGFAYSCADGLVRLGDVVLFYMNGSYWRTDGTAAGTGPLSDVIPGLPNVYLGVGRLGDSIYFWAEDALWRTDGTAAGTLRLRTAAELGLNPILNVYGDGIAWNGLFFWEVQFGKVLRTDGTPAGTRLITDLPGAPNLIGFAPLADRMLMSFQLPEFLWSTQGTPETTHQILELPGYSYGIASVGDTALFCVQTPGTEITHLWLSDGTAEGTHEAPFDGGDCTFMGNAPNVGGRAIYQDRFAVLRGSDGTAAGTSAIRDFAEAPASGGPRNQIALNGRLLFSARTSEIEAPLFLSDGSEAGTHVVSGQAGWASGLARVGNRVFFEAFEQAPPDYYPRLQSTGLWMTNGAPGGTVRVGPAISSYRSPMPVGGSLFFTAAREYSYYNQPDLELYRSNGTTSGTGLVKNINNYSEDTTHHHMCYNAPSNSGPGIELNGRLLFVADDGRKGRELWVSDGSAPGTRLLRDVDPRRIPQPPPGRCDDNREETGLASDPRDFIRYGNRVLFTAADGKAGRELWWTDGTTAGTRRVADLRRGARGSNPHDFVLFRGRVWFIASAQGAGEGLWRTDGTPQKTELVHPLTLGGLPSWARGLTATGDRLFFQLYNETTGAELWTSRGTKASTRMVVDLRPGPAGSYPQALTAAGGLVVFAADDGVHGLEPWQSDGTATGTVLLGDVRPGLDASSPGPFTPVAGGLVLGGADDGEHGRELWAIPVEDPGIEP